MRFPLFIIIYFLGIYLGYAQKDISVAENIVNNRGEVYISIDINNVESYKKVLKKLSFDKSQEGRVFFYANRSGLDAINNSEIVYTVEPIPSMQRSLLMSNSLTDFITNWDSYPTYQQYDSLMHSFAANYSNLCKLHVLGTLNSGRKIFAVQLGDNVSQNENEVKFLYTSTMHGDEVTGYIMMLRLINYLLENYATDLQVQLLMNNIDIWINPLANPDGTYYGGNSTVYGATRYNANSVDINRNFPDPEDGLHPDNNSYQQETQIFMALADSVQFNMSANLHGGSEVVNYPWDTWSKLPADNSWWINVSKKFADSAQFYSPPGYMTKFGTGYVNGYQWYSICGGRQDYMNFYKHCRELTLELSNTKTPYADTLPYYWDYLKHSLLNYLQDAMVGIQGQTIDSVTHFAVKSKLTVLNHDIDSSEVYSNDSGYYYRPIASGTYDLQFSAPFYYSKTIYGVSINQDSILLLNVELVPKPNAISEVGGDVFLDIYPNPAMDILFIKSDTEIKNITLYSIDGKDISHWKNNYSKNMSLKISHFSNGIYYIKVETVKHSIIKKLIIE